MDAIDVDVPALDRAHVWHPYASVPPQVPVHQVVRASGVRLTLADGRELVDGMSSWWAAIHGYGHPRLDGALTAQLADMAHVMFGGLTHEPAVRLARTLAEMTGLPKVFLADSGSVAVEVAIKMAFQFTGRHRLLTVRGGYHGDTFGAMAVCDPVNGMHHLFSGALPQHVFAPRPPAEHDEAYLAELAETVARHASELAAIIVEPVVQGAGGMHFYHPAHLRRLRELADEHGLLLIADEIATGFGRTGELFGCDHAGIRPDIMCVGKALTGGYLSLAATLCTERVAAGIGTLMHGPTFMGNPLAAAVANASLGLLAERPWREEVARIERGLTAGLAGAAHAPGVKDVRVLGAIGVVETLEPVDVGRVQDTVMRHGVWLRPFGRLIYTMPPYATGDVDLARITAAMTAAVADIGRDA
ncbi:adenosylmethionine--8-amino-7-oxononanoate transaminase [Planomonospora parontospora]|uniref:adenosylmethionine--8-amino-7-oxononanoate transaminase n=1 Tax=Planomonospora parontospora TaxID=58119 RepID=UPI00199AE5C8|nr:adenosylmethionine--8-amino-7-oxononanoate transaminase [Planomonospora parontospora]GGL40023.1 adenosylmethionine--8-amino-7-oxononanoate aminotransferase BioA [Planomonospora parontospora subsp. antibiotica]GII16278.1 adenosylmethionine--8-amino-7-oxononanoate aminotransferase BioA [Planomonospora parontospora subsp. antibiotica]